MALERVVPRRGRRTGKQAVHPSVTGQNIGLEFAALVAERLPLRPHQRRYAALQTALRCLACPPAFIKSHHHVHNLRLFSAQADMIGERKVDFLKDGKHSVS